MHRSTCRTGERNLLGRCVPGPHRAFKRRGRTTAAKSQVPARKLQTSTLPASPRSQEFEDDERTQTHSPYLNLWSKITQATKSTQKRGIRANSANHIASRIAPKFPTASTTSCYCCLPFDGLETATISKWTASAAGKQDIFFSSKFSNNSYKFVFLKIQTTRIDPNAEHGPILRKIPQSHSSSSSDESGCLVPAKL